MSFMLYTIQIERWINQIDGKKEKRKKQKVIFYYGKFEHIQNQIYVYLQYIDWYLEYIGVLKPHVIYAQLQLLLAYSQSILPKSPNNFHKILFEMNINTLLFNQ